MKWEHLSDDDKLQISQNVANKYNLMANGKISVQAFKNAFQLVCPAIDLSPKVAMEVVKNAKQSMPLAQEQLKIIELFEGFVS